MSVKPTTEVLKACRLTAQLDKDEILEDLKLFTGGQRYHFKVVMPVINIGGNRKCFGVVEEGREGRLIVCFSWYNPRSAMDFATLGLKMMRTPQELKDNRNHTFSALAEEYYAAPGFAECVNKYNDILLTGFSMGGATSNMMAYHLIEHQHFQGTITVLGFGSPRVGNAVFTEWFKRKLHPTSRNIIAAVFEQEERQEEKVENEARDDCKKKTEKPDTNEPGTKIACPFIFDPVGVTPKLSDGFAFHPNLRLLRGGRLYAPTEGDFKWMAEAEEDKKEMTTGTIGALMNMVTSNNPLSSHPVTQRAWDRTHSVLKYYEFLIEGM